MTCHAAPQHGDFICSFNELLFDSSQSGESSHLFQKNCQNSYSLRRLFVCVTRNLGKIPKHNRKYCRESPTDPLISQAIPMSKSRLTDNVREIRRSDNPASSWLAERVFREVLPAVCGGAPESREDARADWQEIDKAVDSSANRDSQPIGLLQTCSNDVRRIVSS